MISPDYKPIPVEVAKAIAEQYEKCQVIILCYDPVHKLTHTTTYGVGHFEKENAAAAGAAATKFLGGDLARKVVMEDYHLNYDAAICTAALDLLQKMFTLHAAPPWAIGEIESILKQVGRHPRKS